MTSVSKCLREFTGLLNVNCGCVQVFLFEGGGDSELITFQELLHLMGFTINSNIFPCLPGAETASQRTIATGSA